MCVSTSVPDVPTTPERQAAKLPDGTQTADRVDDRARRRMAYAASILTSPQGVLGGAATTANMGMPTKTGV